MENTIIKPSLRSLLSIAFPMIISQASETVMMFADRLFLSQLGKTHIAAAMSGGLNSFVFMSFFLGIINYSNAIVAQFYGARRSEMCAKTTSQAIYLSLAFFPLVLLMTPLGKVLFTAAGHTPEQILLEYSYFRILMIGSLLVFLRGAIVSFFLGLGHTRIVMAASIFGMFFNIPFNYVLIFGKFGFPALGMEGAAIGTVLGSTAMLLFLTVVYFSKPYRIQYKTFSSWSLDFYIVKKIFRYGTAAGAEWFLNIFAFNAFLQLMHSYSEGVAVAVTIAFNWDSLAFIPMLGLGAATTALVAQQLGAENLSGAKEMTKLSLKVGLSYALFMTILFITFAGSLVRVFSASFTAEDTEILRLATILLQLAGLYIVGDVTRLVFAGALRGAGDTRWVMNISVVLHWVLALGALIFIQILRIPPIGTWIFFVIFTLVMGAAMIYRYKTGVWESIKLIDKTE